MSVDTDVTVLTDVAVAVEVTTTVLVPLREAELALALDAELVPFRAAVDVPEGMGEVAVVV